MEWKRCVCEQGEWGVAETGGVLVVVFLQEPRGQAHFIPCVGLYYLKSKWIYSRKHTA